ncbi:uncharacterized protein LOC111133393 [Crassostrea virginica]
MFRNNGRTSNREFHNPPKRKIIDIRRLIGVTPPEFKYCPSYSQSNLNRASTPTTPKPGSPRRHRTRSPQFKYTPSYPESTFNKRGASATPRPGSPRRNVQGKNNKAPPTNDRASRPPRQIRSATVRGNNSTHQTNDKTQRRQRRSRSTSCPVSNRPHQTNNHTPRAPTNAGEEVSYLKTIIDEMEESINYILDAMQARVEFENIEEECARQGYLELNVDVDDMRQVLESILHVAHSSQLHTTQCANSRSEILDVSSLNAKVNDLRNLIEDLLDGQASILQQSEQNISVLNAKVDELRDVMGFFMEYQTFLMQQTDDTSENPDEAVQMEISTSQNNCVVCQEKMSNFIIYDCGHLCICEDCGYQLLSHNDSPSACPVCRARIRDIIRVYRT